MSEEHTRELTELLAAARLFRVGLDLPEDELLGAGGAVHLAAEKVLLTGTRDDIGLLGHGLLLSITLPGARVGPDGRRPPVEVSGGVFHLFGPEPVFAALAEHLEGGDCDLKLTLTTPRPGTALRLCLSHRSWTRLSPYRVMANSAGHFNWFGGGSLGFRARGLPRLLPPPPRSETDAHVPPAGDHAGS